MNSSKVDDQDDSPNWVNESWLSRSKDSREKLNKLWVKYEDRARKRSSNTGPTIGFLTTKTKKFLFGQSRGRDNQSDTYLDIRDKLNLVWDDLRWTFECIALHASDKQTERTVSFEQLEKVLDSIIIPSSKGNEPESEWRKYLALELAMKTLTYVNLGRKMGMSEPETEQLDKAYKILSSRLEDHQNEQSRREKREKEERDRHENKMRAERDQISKMQLKQAKQLLKDEGYTVEK